MERLIFQRYRFPCSTKCPHCPELPRTKCSAKRGRSSRPLLSVTPASNDSIPFNLGGALSVDTNVEAFVITPQHRRSEIVQAAGNAEIEAANRVEVKNQPTRD